MELIIIPMSFGVPKNGRRQRFDLIEVLNQAAPKRTH